MQSVIMENDLSELLRMVCRLIDCAIMRIRGTLSMFSTVYIWFIRARHPDNT